jgi:hypothetical protein
MKHAHARSEVRGRSGPETGRARVDGRGAAHSLGFRVDGPDGRLGTVVATLFGSFLESPDALEVRVGLFHPRTVVVPIDAVSNVDLDRKRLLLHSGLDLSDGSRVPPPNSG